MNERLLARGKLKYDNLPHKKGDWVYGNYVELKDGDRTIHCIYGYGEIIPETLGGYTCLTDKNGKMIFEGDIIEIDHPYNGKSKHTVVWDNYEWNLSDFHASCFDYPSEAFSEGTKYMTVIGNIHDTPELLKEVVQNGG